jgi:ariadne-1
LIIIFYVSFYINFNHSIFLIQCNRLLRWCPSPDCNNAIKVQYVESKPVTCKCNHTFCFHCGENWHDPVKCHLLRRWIKKCDDDSETSNWIAANTKECPKCNVTIEKDGGCNHMVCKSQNCKTEFCWVCLGQWEPHGSSWYNCNRYDEEDAKVARDAQEKSRSALQRYLFYCNRYMNHMQSLKFESKLYASVKEKMEEMQQHNMSWIEVCFAFKFLCLKIDRSIVRLPNNNLQLKIININYIIS